MRDTLCSKEYLVKKIKFNMEQIEQKEEKIVSLQNDIKDGIQRYEKRNEDIIFDVRIRCFQLIYELIRAKYSYGMNCDELQEIYLKGIEHVRVIGYERIGYVNFLQYFSIGLLLEIDNGKLDELVQIADIQRLDDILFEFLVSSCGLKRNTISSCLQKEKPYKELVAIIDAAVIDRHRASLLLRKYIENQWIQGHSDFGWKDAHKKVGYVGLWSFDAAVISKILKLEDEELRDNNNYPYELSHYKNTKKFFPNFLRTIQIDERIDSDQGGIPENKKLEQIIPPQFHELVNQIIRDYANLEDCEIWTKYELGSIWFTIDGYKEQKMRKSLLGAIIINQLVEKGYILQLDYKENVREYISSIGDFWNIKELKLICFDLGDDQKYYAQVPVNAMLESFYEVRIDETTVI